MTRDEAIRVLVRRAAPCFPFTQEIKLHPLCAAEIDSWVELGMLKLDEPKSPIARYAEVISKLPSGFRPIDLIDALDRAGLRIVEK